MLTRKQNQLLLFIQDKLEESGISPSFEEMKDALGLKSKSGVHRLISALEERGFIRRLPHRARALEILKLPGEAAAPRPEAVGREASNVVTANFARPRPLPTSIGGSMGGGMAEIPLHGRIAAGTPIEALQNTDNMISVPPSMLGTGAHYALEISGDSMIEAGIYDGDTAIIRSCDTADNGEIVVALVDNEEATLKTLHKHGDQIALEPANRSHSTQLLSADRVRIQGRLVALMRRY